jgi:lipopolysaccharide/colanic/teichoic acid biosynthesis glycosyltransferase
MRRWERLPDGLRTAAVRPYYEALCKKRFSLACKRAGDIIFSLLGTVALLPVFFVIALLVAADSKGPVFYRQKRVTRYGRVFSILKFRTMVVGADKKGPSVTVDHDARVTKIGCTLRKYRLDELPQLINVLLGDMSFVGTRPEVERYVAAYSKEMMATLLLPAGITSAASLAFRNENERLTGAQDPELVYIEEILPEKMAINLSYVRHFTLLEDIRIIGRTVRHVFDS